MVHMIYLHTPSWCIIADVILMMYDKKKYVWCPLNSILNTMTFSINQQQVHFITDQSVFFVQNLQYGMFRKISSVKAPRVLYKK